MFRRSSKLAGLFYAFLLMLALLLSACSGMSSSGNATPAASQVVTSTATATPIPLPTDTPTPTPGITPVVAFTPTPIPTPSGMIDPKKLPSLGKNPTDSEVRGFVSGTLWDIFVAISNSNDPDRHGGEQGALQLAKKPNVVLSVDDVVNCGTKEWSSDFVVQFCGIGKDGRPAFVAVAADVQRIASQSLPLMHDYIFRAADQYLWKLLAGVAESDLTPTQVICGEGWQARILMARGYIYPAYATDQLQRYADDPDAFYYGYRRADGTLPNACNKNSVQEEQSNAALLLLTTPGVQNLELIYSPLLHRSYSY